MRSAFFIIGILGALFVSWWVPVLCMILPSLRYRAWEVLALGLVCDFLWLPAGIGHIPYFTLASIVIVWACEPLRVRLFV